VRADPEPDKVVTVANGQSAVAQGNSCRENGSRRMDLFELKAGMARVLHELAVGAASALLHSRGKCIESGTKPGGGV